MTTTAHDSRPNTKSSPSLLPYLIRNGMCTKCSIYCTFSLKSQKSLRPFHHLHLNEFYVIRPQQIDYLVDGIVIPPKLHVKYILIKIFPPYQKIKNTIFYFYLKNKQKKLIMPYWLTCSCCFWSLCAASHSPAGWSDLPKVSRVKVVTYIWGHAHCQLLFHHDFKTIFKNLNHLISLSFIGDI